MAKKDTYLALLRRGIDETTAQILSDGGIKIGDLKKLDSETLINNFGIKEQIIFPEINYDNIDNIRGMDVCINTTATSHEHAKALLKAFNFPFKQR